MKTNLTRSSLPTFCLRLARMSLHFLAGFAILALRYPHLSREKRGAATRNWSRKLLKVLAIELRVSGTIPDENPHNTLQISNHISWLDIIVLACTCATRYIAKREIRRWPMIGWMAHLGGTLFIDRSNRRDASRVNRQMAKALRDGDCLTVFPEGTTSDGHSLLPFKSSLFESALLAGSTIQPVTIRYLDATGQMTTAPSYAGHTTFWQSLKRLLRLRKLIVELHYGTPIRTDEGQFSTRFALADAARREIARDFSPATDKRGKAAMSVVCPPVEAQ